MRTQTTSSPASGTHRIGWFGGMAMRAILLVTLLEASSAFTLRSTIVQHSPRAAQRMAPVALSQESSPFDGLKGLFGGKETSKEESKEEDTGMTLEKVAAFGIAGVLSIAVAETVFWVLSFPTSELLYFVSTGEWINLTTQEGQLKFLAFTAGWGALGGVIAQYRTVLTAAAMTPWMDANVVKPYVQPLLEKMGKSDSS